MELVLKGRRSKVVFPEARSRPDPTAVAARLSAVYDGDCFVAAFLAQPDM
jgi:hypothetical protein